MITTMASRKLVGTSFLCPCSFCFTASQSLLVGKQGKSICQLYQDQADMNCRGAVNPALDFSGRLMSNAVGYPNTVWSSGGYYFWVCDDDQRNSITELT